jgi:hypothetical protein
MNNELQRGGTTVIGVHVMVDTIVSDDLVYWQVSDNGGWGVKSPTNVTSLSPLEP